MGDQGKRLQKLEQTLGVDQDERIWLTEEQRDRSLAALGEAIVAMRDLGQLDESPVDVDEDTARMAAQLAAAIEDAQRRVKNEQVN